ncbi:insertase [Comamonas testosteroni]|uniref:Membrane protein insertase YidC n=1 Tax=Comamonas testosteroni TaxID=285 RepID=A0A096F848_COMTE|nr:MULTISPECIES: membrane protein insertase YidC [Comamonas]KGH25913.1 insertase [Comamonas testosteroni]KOC24984.1 insertase [Comamonas testosteroni]KWT65094.1 Inner membrane protein translocase component YidC, long form [Comamonas testosteroni]MDN5502557.1 membrane protein insertase YidC [Comamonas sp.]MDN5536455.1 membrane protein insertase YidC [Comamonas sp.]
MNDIRRTILWVIFGFSMVLLWDKWQIHNGKKPTFFPSPQTVSAPAAADVKPADVSVPQPAAAASAGDVPGAANAAAQPAAAVTPRQDVIVGSDVMRLTFDSEGGTLKASELLKYSDTTDDKKLMQVFEENAKRVYLGQTGLIGGNFPTHKTPMTVMPGERELKDGQDSVQVRFESADQGGVKLIKTFTLKRGSYAVDVQHDVVNTGSTAVNPQLYMQLVRDGNKPEHESSFYSTFTGPAVYTEAKKYHKVEFKDIESGKAEVDKASPNGFVAMVQHYFASAWLLADGIQRDNFVRKVGDNLYAVGMITPVGTVEPGQTKTVSSRLFSGPQIEPMLEKLSPGLELVKDYGWLTILAKPLYWLLSELHKFIGNWGWSIVALVVLLKIAFYWLNAKAYSSMAKMKAINPRIQEMRERLKDKPQQMQQEMMRIYREEKVNPMGGCLPIVIQIPVFMALYWVLQSSVEIRNAPWIGWIHDLSVPDPFFILPLLMTLSSLLQTALNPAPPDPMQAKMMWIMPLMFSVMFFFFPSGLVLYWLTNNILSIAQQWIINKRMGVPPQFNLPKFGKAAEGK